MPAVDAATITDDAFLLDVRDDEEWHAGHAEGAHHVPMMELLARLDEVPTDRDVVVVCKVGARSAQVTAYLVGQGWDRVRNLDGGMLAWVGAGRPLVREDGHAARVL